MFAVVCSYLHFVEVPKILAVSLHCQKTKTPTRYESVGCDGGRFISPKEYF